MIKPKQVFEQKNKNEECIAEPKIVEATSTGGKPSKKKQKKQIKANIII